jgi:hypothetical protein
VRSVDDCFEILGLPNTAGESQVTARFRRLARELHPDVSPTAAARDRFEEVVEAYNVLRAAFKARSTETLWERCPRCGLYDDLLRANDGGHACADCLLGRSYRSRFLPLPDFVSARHLAVIALYAAAILLAALFVTTSHWTHAITSLVCATAGMGLLAFEVFALNRANPHHRHRPLHSQALRIPHR